MSIPMSFTEDIVGIEDLMLRAIIVVLKFVEEKMDLFAIFPMGATMQDGGKRKRSDGSCLLRQPIFDSSFHWWSSLFVNSRHADLYNMQDLYSVSLYCLWVCLQSPPRAVCMYPARWLWATDSWLMTVNAAEMCGIHGSLCRIRYFDSFIGPHTPQTRSI